MRDPLIEQKKEEKEVNLADEIPEDKLKEIQQDIIAEYQQMLQGKDIVPHRYLLYDDLYNGKYKQQYFSCFGYEKENNAAQPFLKLVNRLALTHTGFYNQFVEDWESKDANEVNTLLEIFDGVNKRSYKDLNKAIDTIVAAYAENYEDNEKRNVNEINKFINQILNFKPKNKNNDYFELSDFITDLKGSHPNIKLQYRDILKIRKLREDCRNAEVKLSGTLKTLKKDINHYLLSLKGEKRRITRLDPKEGDAFQEKYRVDKMLDENQITAKHALKAKKDQHKFISKLVGRNVAVGEGAVAGVAMGGFLATLGVAAPIALPIGVLTGIGGAICNYYLVRDDTNLMLNQIRLKDMFGKLSKNERDVALLLGSCSLATGFVYGALSAMKLYSGLLMPLFTTMHASHTTAVVLGTGIASLPVMFTAIGFASIFFFVIADAIKNDPWLSTKTYFHKNYIDLGWREMTHGERFSTAVGCFGNFLKLMLGVTINLIITVVSFGIFHSSGVKLLSTIANNSIANSMSMALTIINSFIITAFGLQKINQILQETTWKDIGKTLFLLVPYYLPKLTMKIVSLGLGALCALPGAAVLAISSIPELLVHLVTHTLQIALGLVHSVLKMLLDLPKNLLMLPPLAIATIGFIVAGVLQIIRTPFSLLYRQLCSATGTDILAGMTNPLNYLSAGLMKIAFSLLAATNWINNKCDATYLKSELSKGFNWLQNGIADSRAYLNQKMQPALTAVYIAGLAFYKGCTQLGVCNFLFGCLFGWMNTSTDKKPTSENEKLPSKKLAEKNNGIELNPIQKSVISSAEKATMFAKGCAGLNSTGQAALMVGNASVVASSLHQAAAPVVAGCEFFYSVAPLNISIDATIANDMQVTPALPAEEKQDGDEKEYQAVVCS